MRGVFLDKMAIGKDVDWTALSKALTHWDFFENTQQDKVAQRIESAQVIVTKDVAITAEHIAAAKSLALICTATTGVNHIDIAAAEAHGVVVKNVPDYSTNSVVQQTFAFILALSSQLLPYQADIRRGEWSNSPIFCCHNHLATELFGKKIGIIGYGNIGKRVASISKAFGMEVFIAAHPERRKALGALSLEKLLPRVDILSIHCPLTPSTHHLIGATELALMKPTAILINTARGNIVDEDALAQALRNGRIAGAGLDVLSQEPPPADHPLLAYKSDNLLLSPHVAWAYQEAKQRLIDYLAKTIAAFQHEYASSV